MTPGGARVGYDGKPYLKTVTIPSYVRPPNFVFERFTIAIMCNESLELHWQDEQTELSYLTRVFPREIVAENSGDYLIVRDDEGAEHKIRLDLIRNMPRPFK